MSNKYEIAGTLKVLSDTQSFASGFQKREFVIETHEDKYPQTVKLESVKEGCDKLNAYAVGDVLKVYFNIRGNEHNGKYYTSLQAWKVEKIGQVYTQSETSEAQPQAKQAPAAKDDKWIDESSDVPF